MSQDKFALSEAFGPDHAAAYDNQFEELQAIKGLLHLILETGLGKLPDNARILVAGAGPALKSATSPHDFPNGSLRSLILPAPCWMSLADLRRLKASRRAARFTMLMSRRSKHSTLRAQPVCSYRTS